MAEVDELGNETIISPEESANESTCIPDCKEPDEKKCVTCLLCAKNYHCVCVNFKTKAANPVFTCFDCRSLFVSLKSMCRDVALMKKNVSKQLTDINKLMVKKDEVNTKLTTENAELRCKVASLTTELQQARWKSFTNENDSDDLVLSDSVLSAVDAAKLQNTGLVCVPGGKIETLTTELEKPTHQDKSYNRIVLVVSSDAASDNSNASADVTTDIVPKFASLIEKAKIKASQVCVSSVCPRLDRVDAKDRIEALNANLQVLCDEKECEFVDNTPSFSLGDGSINDGYLAMGKGPQLSKAGVNKLVKNLKLRTRPNVIDVTRSQNKKSSPRQQNRSPDGHNLSSGRKWRSNQSAPNRPYSPSTGYTKSTESFDSDVKYNKNACYFCNEPGHRSSICKHGGPVSCHGCGEKGHKQKHHSSFLNDSQNYEYY